MKPSWFLWFSPFWEILSEWCFAILCCFISSTQIYYENFSLYFHAHQLQFLKSYNKKVYCLFHLHHSDKFLYLLDPHKILQCDLFLYKILQCDLFLYNYIMHKHLFSQWLTLPHLLQGVFCSSLWKCCLFIGWICFLNCLILFQII